VPAFLVWSLPARSLSGGDSASAENTGRDAPLRRSRGRKRHPVVLGGDQSSAPSAWMKGCTQWFQLINSDRRFDLDWIRLLLGELTVSSSTPKSFIAPYASSRLLTDG